jgi:hypothetical protein
MSRRRFLIPAPPPQTTTPEAFVQVFVSSLPPGSEEDLARMRALYEWAFREAQAASAPSLPERDLLGVWN